MLNDLSDSELRLIHELMFFLPPHALEEARKKLIEKEDSFPLKLEFKWGNFLRVPTNDVYRSLANKLDCRFMVSPSVMR